ncbi:hypothetical protein OIO90_002980 [Microbotryomycetes sp. JL221]|nr:hypothetical protein OIO90_002980 [Microbotryomycetes sp. JL221]
MSIEEFDSQVKTALGRGKALSSSTVTAIVDMAMQNIRDDAHVVATLYKQHKRASSGAKLYSLYLIDAVAREARTRAKKRKAAGNQGSTTPTGSPKASSSSTRDGDETTFLKKLDALLSKIIMDCWDNGKAEHKASHRFWLK